MMTPFRALVRKDLLLFFSDRRAVIVGLLVPIICGSFFGYLFGGHSGKTETSRMPVLFIDQDNSAISRGLFSQLGAEKNLEVKPSTLEEARTAVRKGKATAAIVIPKEFGADAGRAFLASGKKPEISVLYDPSHNMELGMVQGILSGAVMQVVSKEMFTGNSGRETVKQSLAQLDQDTGMAPASRKSLRDLLGSVEKWNEQQERAHTSGKTCPKAD